MTYLTTTWQYFRRSPYQAFAAIFILTQTFFVISLFTLFIVGASRVIDYFESKPQISAYFQNEAKQTDVTKLEKSLQQTGKIAKIKFISKQQALAIYKQQNKNDPLLLELVTPDTLPASFEISTVSIEDLPLVAGVLKNYPIVKEVIFQKDVVDKLTSWTNALRKIGIGLSAILALDSIFLMMIIISIKISQKRREIEIMRLIGATNWYIRWPFIFEGMLYAVIGACVGWLLSIIILWYLMPYLSSFLGDIPVFSVGSIFLVELLGVENLLAIGLGSVAGYLATVRYLR